MLKPGLSDLKMDKKFLMVIRASLINYCIVSAKLTQKKLSELGKVVRSASPPSADLVIKFGKKFLCMSKSDKTIDKRGDMLHAFFSLQ